MFAVTSLLLTASAAGIETIDLVAFERANFVQTRELTALDHPLVSKGTVTLTADGFIWHQIEPFENRLTFDGDTLVEQIHVGDGVIEQPQNDPVTLSITRSLYQMMSGSLASLERNFQVTTTGDPEHGWTAELVPIDEGVSEFLSRIVLEGHQHLSLISVDQSNGISTRIMLTDQE